MNDKFLLFSLNIIFSFFIVSTPSQANSKIDVVELTAEQAHKDLVNRKYTSKALTEAFLARIKTYNPDYNAIITFNENALKDAEKIDQRRQAGEKLGPLAGIPIVIKDTMNMKGLPTTAGWAPISSRAGGIDLIPSQDSAVVGRMKAAGAIIIGKTNVPILSLSATNANNSWAGVTYNAVDISRAPGGSSAGTATAVSASFAILGLGEETGGSIQNPAAAQALVSIKPTFGLVPNTGVFPLATSTRDVVGPMTKTVFDAAITLDALAGYSSDDPKTLASNGKIPEQGYTSQLNKMALKGKRIGIYGAGWRNADLSEETKKLYKKSIDELKALGAIIVEDPFKGTAFSQIAKPIEVAGIGGYDSRGEDSVAYDLERYLSELGPQSPVHSIQDLVTKIQKNPFDDEDLLAYIKAQPGFIESLKNPTVVPKLTQFIQAREDYIRTFNQVMNEQKLDALIFPQMRTETPLLMSTDVISDTTVSEINIGGFPAITVPAGYYHSGSAFGLIFIGRLWSEAELLGMAYAYEQATNKRITPQLKNIK